MSKKFLFLLALVMGEAVCMETITEVVDDGFGVNFTKFDVSKDQKYEIKFKYNNELLYQPVETKNGILFFGEHALNSERKPIESRYNPNRSGGMWLFEGFPQYPIVSGLKTDGHFSLKNLSTVLEEDILKCAVINVATNFPIGNMLNPRIEGHMTVAQKLPDGLRKLAQLNMLGNTKSWEVRAQFNQEKEELYLSLSILNRLRGDYNEEQFLGKIYDIDEKLNAAFNSGVNNKGAIQNSDKLKKIEERLTHKLPTVRHAIAKALLVNVFSHPDKYPKSPNKNQEDFLCINYGEMARFVHHIKERRHVYGEGNTIPMYTDKSYWVLKEGFTAANLYKALYDVNCLNALKINQVYIEGTMQNGIVIDLEDPTLLDRVKNMVHAYWDGATRAANLIRIVIKENNGFFKLATAHPIYSANATIQSSENVKSVFTALNNHFLYKPFTGTIAFLNSSLTPATGSF